MAVTRGSGKGISVIVGTDYNDRDLKRLQRDLHAAGIQAKKTMGPMGQLSNGFKKQLTPNFAAMGMAAAAAGAALAAFAIKLAVDGVMAAAAEEQALAKLQTALDNVGQGYRLAELESFVDGLQRATGVADDELRPALQTLVTATGNATQAQELLTLALDISVATGNDLTSVAKALAKAANGQYTAVNKLTNNALNPSVVATKDLSLVTDELTRLFGGAAQANADTFAGKMDILKIAFDELLESFGEGFIEGFTDGADVTGDLSDAFKKAEPGMREFGKAVGDLAIIFSYVAPYIDEFVNLLKYAIPLSIAGMVAAFPPLGPVLAWLGVGFLETKAAVDAAGESVDVIGVKFTGPMSDAAQSAMRSFEGVGDEAEDAEDALKLLNDEMDRFFGFMDQRDAVRGYEAAIDSFSASLKENGKNFDTNTEAGRKNEESLDGVYKAALQVAEGQATAAEKIATMREGAAEAKRQLDRTNMSEGAKQRLLQPFDDAILKFQTATSQVGNLKAEMERLPTKKTFTYTVIVTGDKLPPGTKEEWWGSNDATGGSVGSHSIRRGISRGVDSIPMLLAPGEFVVRKSAVDKFGASLFSQLNRGINPLEGMSPSGSGRSGGVSVGTINVTSAAGERAETSLPRALRRMAFLAGMS